MVMGEFTQETEVLVIGGGPGGYAAAFHAADLGLEVTLVDLDSRPGGVCLFRGCIPSKTFLYAAEILEDAGRAKTMGITFQPPDIDLVRLRAWKQQVVDRLADGLVGLCKKRGVQFIRGRVAFEAPDRVRLSESDSEISHFKFQHAILATGSHPISLPGVEIKPGGRIMDSTGALELPDVPEKLLVVGGGYVGAEMGSVYAALGSRVTVVEREDRLMAGADQDLVKPLARKLEGIFDKILLNCAIKSMEEHADRVEVTFEGEAGETQQTFDRVLIAIGRQPHSRDIGLENTAVKTDRRGFVIVDEQQRTAEPNVFAIGDVVGGVMLAHKAMYEGKIAADVIAGKPSAFDARAIPAVVYTNPQLAWCGLTEEEARRRGQSVKVSRFPWGASGRAVSMGVSKGLSKVIIDPESERILGVGIVGYQAGELIAEGVLAVEMGAVAEDVALSIHPHPTLSEGEEEAAEAFLGAATHILSQRKDG